MSRVTVMFQCCSRMCVCRCMCTFPAYKTRPAALGVGLPCTLIPNACQPALFCIAALPSVPHCTPSTCTRSTDATLRTESDNNQSSWGSVVRLSDNTGNRAREADACSGAWPCCRQMCSFGVGNVVVVVEASRQGLDAWMAVHANSIGCAHWRVCNPAMGRRCSIDLASDSSRRSHAARRSRLGPNNFVVLMQWRFRAFAIA